MNTITTLDEFTRAYIECALWSSTVEPFGECASCGKAKVLARARKIQRDDAKLRKLGGQGNYSDVCIRVTFERCHGRKEYGVFVEVNS